jgi:hypothetical protein
MRQYRGKRTNSARPACDRGDDGYDSDDGGESDDLPDDLFTNGKSKQAAKDKPKRRDLPTKQPNFGSRNLATQPSKVPSTGVVESD